MSEIFIIIIIAIIIAVILGFKKQGEHKDHKNITEKKISELSDFDLTDKYLSTNSGISIGYDHTKKKVCFINGNHEIWIYNYNHLIACELIIDGESVSKQSTASAIGRGIIGGALAGGVGAIVGGVTSSSTQKEMINKISLKITIDDTSNPLIKILFLDAYKIKKGTWAYNDAIQNAERWHAIISGLIITKNEKERPKQNDLLSVADELKKLKDLLDQGVITEDEFNKQKNKLLE